MNTNKTEKLLLLLSKEMMDGILKLKQETGLSMNAIVRLAIREYLNKK